MSPSVDLSLATRASNPDAVPGLIQDLNALHGSMKDGDEETRHQLVVKTRRLLQSLLTPREQMVQHTWADVRPSTFPILLLNVARDVPVADPFGSSPD